MCWLGLKNLPLNFFNDQETKNFFSLLNKEVVLPNKNKLSTMVTHEFDLMRDNLKNVLKKNSSKFAFTVDGWSSKTRQSY